jgi:two-component system, cell cycle sensor histidine kinase and response regulator CckA
VHSEPGKGTTFKIYLPACESEQCKGETSEISDAPTGTETVLLVEDEEAVLGIYKTMLKKLGYTILSANNTADAVELAQKYEDDIHILLTDVVMPGSGGSNLWKKLSVIRPGMKCLFMSGYTFDVISKQGVLEEGVNYLQKPFSIETLARKMREVLDS